MKIKHRENLTQTEKRECCLQTFEMLTPRPSGNSLNFNTLAFSR